MISLTSGAILACFIGVISGHVDNILTSPDVDIQAGFFPDSSYSLSSPQDQGSPAPAPAPAYNRLVEPLDPAAVLAKRLRLLMANLSRRKSFMSQPKAHPVTSNAENPLFLHLFTGSKDNKG